MCWGAREDQFCVKRGTAFGNALPLHCGYNEFSWVPQVSSTLCFSRELTPNPCLPLRSGRGSAFRYSSILANAQVPVTSIISTQPHVFSCVLGRFGAAGGNVSQTRINVPFLLLCMPLHGKLRLFFSPVRGVLKNLPCVFGQQVAFSCFRKHS